MKLDDSISETLACSLLGVDAGYRAPQARQPEPSEPVVILPNAAMLNACKRRRRPRAGCRDLRGMLIEALKAGPLDTEDLAQVMKVDKHAIYDSLMRAEKAGVVHRVGKVKRGTTKQHVLWALTEGEK